MNNWVFLFLAVLAAVLVLGGLVAATRYRRWLGQCERRLEGGSKIMNTPGGPIEYAIWGTGGPVILCVHGTPGGYDQGRLLGEAAAAQGFWLISVSRPGYLRTPLALGRRPEEQADALAALLDGLGIHRAALVGLSGGGPAALQFALRHPDRCTSLVAVSAVNRQRPPSRKRFTGWLLASRFFTSNFGGWLIGSAIQLRPAVLPEAIVPDASIRASVLADPRRYAALAEIAQAAIQLPARRRTGMRNDDEQFANLPAYPFETMRVPTLIIHGTADENIPFASAQMMAQTVPGAELYPIAGGTHAAFMTHSDQVFTRLFDFVGAPGKGKITG